MLLNTQSHAKGELPHGEQSVCKTGVTYAEVTRSVVECYNAPFSCRQHLEQHDVTAHV